MSEDTGGKVPWYMTLLHEKEQNILMLGEEITRLSEFEEECSKKDQEISVLQEKLTELTIYHNEDVAELIVRLSEEVRNLREVEKEVQEKSQQITRLEEELHRLREASPGWGVEHGGFGALLDKEATHSETEHQDIEQVVVQLQEEVSQRKKEVAEVKGQTKQLSQAQKVEREAQRSLRREVQVCQETIDSLNLQSNNSLVALE
ncbi:hypothetical protein J4Q44_G00217790 [Coregonus suidteri]|uniref:Uncharacterized protein n=1 Tax=Coregonus suidteri TaxID=861788 RepID=A0AAN8QRS9_9TELE